MKMQDKVTLLREKWAEALESGEYEQYRGKYSPGGIIDVYNKKDNVMCATAVLWRVSQSLGFHYDMTDVLLKTKINYKIMQNDNDRIKLSFPEIAAKLRNGEYDVR